jgi:outer membrane protein assembly factor BamA
LSRFRFPFEFKPFLFIVAFCSVLPNILYAGDDSLHIRGLIIDSLTFQGNKVTRGDIILRELALKKGDTLSADLFTEKTETSKKNLLNTSLFNYVDIVSRDIGTVSPASLSGSISQVGLYRHISIVITFRERWYTWPIPIFELYEQNFNTWWLNPTLYRLDYGLYLNQYNFLGRKQTLSFAIRLGYVEQYGITYTIPYIDKAKRSGLVFGVSYSRAREIPYGSQNNEFLFYRDDANPVRQDWGTRVTYTYRQGFYNTWFAETRFVHAQIQDTLKSLNENYFSNNQSSLEYVSFSAGFVRDLRDSKPYPLRGYYINTSLTCYTLGLVPGQNADIWSFNLMLRKYLHLGGRFYAGTSFKGRYTGNEQVPFYLQSTLGYKDYVRGYEYYVMEGQSFGLLKNVVRYELVKPHIRKIPYLPWEKFNTFHYAFYADLFADLGYIQNLNNKPEMGNTLDNTMLYGYGAGIDFVTYYDFVLRAEVALNKMGECGFFLHLNSPL